MATWLIHDCSEGRIGVTTIEQVIPDLWDYIEDTATLVAVYEDKVWIYEGHSELEKNRFDVRFILTLLSQLQYDYQDRERELMGCIVHVSAFRERAIIIGKLELVKPENSGHKTTWPDWQ